MNRPELVRFLTGQFATWLASEGGRSAPNKEDKRIAAMAAEAAVTILFPGQGQLALEVTDP